MSKLFKNKELTIVILWSVCVILYVFSHIATDSRHIMLGNAGDGAKNYCVYLYHSLYENGVWFHGMNYPFGEHIVFPDLQPLLSTLYIQLNKIVPLDQGAALSIMHWGICFSFFLALIFNFKILRFYKVSFPWALLGATCITIMSPQMMRVAAHYALSYPSLPAMLFYFSIRYYHSAHWKYCLYIFLTGTIMYFMHPYYLAICAMWIAFYILSYFITQYKKPIKKSILHLAPMGFAAILMFVVAQSFMMLTDPVKDRPRLPYGAMDYAATGDQILTSGYSPLCIIFQQKGWIQEISWGGEGFGYIGFVATVVCIVAFIVAVVRLFKKKEKTFAETDEISSRFPRIWIWMSLFCLLLAMGVPFVWNMEWLLDYVSVFRQFRSLGRFIWMFYQLVTIYSFIFLYRYYKTIYVKAGKLAIPIMAIPVMLWCFETRGYVWRAHHMADDGRRNYDEFFNAPETRFNEFLAAHHRQASEFQAILLLPYIHVGSDKWSVGTELSELMGAPFRMCLKTKLPIVDVMMPRCSWGQTAKQVRISGGVYADRPLLNYKPDKPFIALVPVAHQLNPDEASLLVGADSLGVYDHCTIYVLYPAKALAYAKAAKNNAASIASRMANVDTVLNGEAGSYLFIDHLDKGTNTHILWGGGAQAVIGGTDSVELQMDVKPEKDSVLYEISSWVLVSKTDFRVPLLNLSLLDSSGNEIFKKDAWAKESVDNYGMWFRVHLYFRLPEECRQLRWHLYNGDKKSYLALDEIQLRPAGVTIISRKKGSPLMVNNHIIHE